MKLNREVTLAEVLEARDQRAARQQTLLARYSVPLVSFTMNIPGPVKYSTAIHRVFSMGLTALEAAIPTETVRCREVTIGAAGCEAILAVDLPPMELKTICTALEDGTKIGRLYDFDVLDVDGRKLDRSLVGGNSRDCIVCGKPGRLCAASRAHSVAELQSAVNRLIDAHLFCVDAERIAEAAELSLREEVLVTPKPGLVDGSNCGCHRDMGVETFLASAAALRPYFYKCIELGHRMANEPPCRLFPKLRQAGLEAEQTMFAATGGVNTHKGAIYTMGVLCGAVGRLWQPDQPLEEADRLLALCGEIAGPAVEADFAGIRARGTAETAGERLYLQHGLTGIRGQVAAGLPAVRDLAMPVYGHCIAAGMTENHAACVTLLHLIANVEDTNLWHRGGAEGAAFARAAAADLLQRNSHPEPAEICRLDALFIARNLSPGGCADLLAVTCFLRRLERYRNETAALTAK